MRCCDFCVWVIVWREKETYDGRVFVPRIREFVISGSLCSVYTPVDISIEEWRTPAAAYAVRFGSSTRHLSKVRLNSMHASPGSKSSNQRQHPLQITSRTSAFVSSQARSGFHNDLDCVTTVHLVECFLVLADLEYVCHLSTYCQRTSLVVFNCDNMTYHAFHVDFATIEISYRAREAMRLGERADNLA